MQESIDTLNDNLFDALHDIQPTVEINGDGKIKLMDSTETYGNFSECNINVNQLCTETQ